MDVEAYITSGVLEAYVLGTATDKERREVECLSSIHEEIGHELESIRLAMEHYASVNVVAPPSALKDKIMAGLDTRVLSMQKETVVPSPPPQNGSQAGKNLFNLYRIAAGVALLLSAAFAVMFIQNGADIETIKRELASVTDSRFQIEQELNNTRNQLLAHEAQIVFLQDSATIPVPLKGIPAKSPDALVTVFWNKSTKEAYVKVLNLPEPPVGKQYQLWGIVDGKPQDMGVFLMMEEAILQKVKNVEGAQAFAITLEPTGGSADPTLSEMYVAGEV